MANVLLTKLSCSLICILLLLHNIYNKSYDMNQPINVKLKKINISVWARQKKFFEWLNVHKFLWWASSLNVRLTQTEMELCENSFISHCLLPTYCFRLDSHYGRDIKQKLISRQFADVLINKTKWNMVFLFPL